MDAILGTPLADAADDDRPRTLLVSDLHIPSDGGPALDGFRDLLADAAASPGCRVVVLGDLFDAYTGPKQARTGVWQATAQALAAGIPHLRILAPYAPAGASLAELGTFLRDVMDGHVTPGRLAEIRDAWPGKLVVKGVLDPADAEVCRQIGADALVISNHGGRQLDAAPSALEVIDAVRAAAGPEMPVLVDGAMRSGLDVARMLAAGADFVMLGRAFMLGPAALGAKGGDHVVRILREELRSTMAQIGCARVADLPRFRI